MLVVLAFLLVAVLVGRRAPAGALPAVRLLEHRLAPPAVFAAASAAFAWCWGSLRAIPVIHDEAAYVLQARIFASGRWVAPARPLPEFWEQFHVFVTPALAPKYPPGHALLMVPGVWLGLPGLVPVLLLGATAMLLFVLARRLTDGATALLAVVVWMGAPGVLTFFPSYYSESTSCALWLSGWWLLLRWRETRRGAFLWVLAAVTGWGAITRPLTMLVFAIPVAVVVLRDAWRVRAWRDMAIGFAVGTALLGIVPLWSAGTLGEARLNPYSHYSRVYFPFDRPGFGADYTPPSRPLPPDMQQFLTEGQARRAAFVPATLPSVLGERVMAVARDLFGGWRWLLLPALVVGIFAVPGPGRLALGTGLLLVLAYLGFSHPSHWSLYYLEAQMGFAFVVAAGMARLLRWTGRTDASSSGIDAREQFVVLAVAVALAALLPGELVGARARQVEHTAYHARFRRVLGTIPDSAAVVFVRYSADHNLHKSLIENEPDLERARIWVVRDRGADNARLLRLAGGRVPYLYDERTRTVTRMMPSPR